MLTVVDASLDENIMKKQQNNNYEIGTTNFSGNNLYIFNLE